MVTASLSSCPTAFNGSRFIKIQTAATFLGVSLNTCRSLADSGQLGPIHRTLGNHRRLEARAVYAYAYGDDEFEQGDSQGRLVGIIRVSSRSQSKTVGSSDKSSLDHQRERIVAYCLEKYGREPDEIIESVGSGLNFDRPEFLGMIKRVVSGDLRGATIVATDFTRICRFGIRLVEFLFELGGVEIEYSMDEREAKSLNESLVDDVLSILQHFCARVSGNKARKAVKVIMDPDSLKEAHALYKQGYSYRHIAKVLEQQGKADSKGRRFSRAIVRQNLLDQWEYLEATFNDNQQQQTSFETFVQKRIRKASEKTRLGLKRILQVYEAWCVEQEITPMCFKKISPIIKKLGWVPLYDVKKCRLYGGLVLLKE